MALMLLLLLQYCAVVHLLSSKCITSLISCFLDVGLSIRGYTHEMKLILFLRSYAPALFYLMLILDWRVLLSLSEGSVSLFFTITIMDILEFLQLCKTFGNNHVFM